MKNTINNTKQTLGNVFYRRHYSKLLTFLKVMVVINIVLSGILIYLVTHIPVADTYASYENKTSALRSLPAPIVSQQALLDWASQAVISIYNFDFVNYPKQMKVAKGYFTPRGWSLFQSNFNKVVQTVIDKKLRVGAVVTGAPVVVERGPLLGSYSWKIRMPVLVTYESANKTEYQPLLVDMVVTRVDTRKMPKGIAIVQFISLQRTQS